MKPTKWVKDRLTKKDGLSDKEAEYYRVFNLIYYDAWWPTKKWCKTKGSTLEIEESRIAEILGISVPQMWALKKEAEARRYLQKNDVENIAINAPVEKFEIVTNRKRKKTSDFEE